MALLAEGLDSRQIADKACLSEKTLRNYLSNIYRKLNVTNRTQAVIAFQREWRKNSP